MTEDELKAIDDIAANAPEGPWELATASSGNESECDIIGPDLRVVAHDVPNAAAVFITHTRENIPALVAAARRSVDVIRAIIDASDDCQGHSDCVHSMLPWGKARELLYQFDNDQEALAELRRLMASHERYR